ncbi:MAG: VCBS repeat-containing protein [Planctomycetota bacterium]
MLRMPILVALGALLGPIAAASAQERLFDSSGPVAPWLTQPVYSKGLIPTGDMTGDGIPDFAVSTGKSSWEIRSGANGQVSTTLGSASLLTWGLPDAASVGDVTGDGLDDLLIVEDTDIVLRESTVNFPVWTRSLPAFTGPWFNPSASPAIAVLDDLDGDGYPEFALGIKIAQVYMIPPYSLPGLPLPTDVEIRSGANGSLLSIITPPLPAPLLLPGILPALSLRRLVRTGEDLNGDGVRDLMVAEVSGSDDYLNVYDPTTGQTLLSINLGPTTFGDLAYSMAAFDDLDADGLADICIGRPASQAAGANAGRLSIHSSATGAVLRQIDGAPHDFLGYRIAVGDIDQDGIRDVAAAAAVTPGFPRISVFSGATGHEIWRSDLEFPRMDAAGFLDLDGDGHSDLVTGASDTYSSGSSVFRAFRGEADLGPAASSGLPGGENILRVNGGYGAWSRHVRVARASPLQIALDAPAGQSAPLTFAIFAYLGTVQPSDAVDLGPPYGKVMFLPAPFYPAAVPVLFTLGTNVPGLAGTIYLAPYGPWSLSLPAGIDATISLSLQALIVDAQGMIRRSNGIVLDVQ